MKLVTAAAAALAALLPAAAQAQTATAAETPAAAAKYNLDTPIEALVADEKAKAVLDAGIPGLTTHPSYEFFKGMSLKQVQPLSEGKLTDELLAKTEADLAALD